jgi:hypothetical protein
MKVRLYDGEDFSDGVASIQISVTAGNATPTFTTSAFTYSPGISENGALLVTYNDLLSYTGAADADGDIVRFKVTSLTTGSLTINGTNYTTSASVAAAAQQIGPGQTFVWRPAADVNGVQGAFGIKLTDTVAESAEVAVSVTVSALNSAPTIANTTATIYGAARYTTSANPFVISYSTLTSALGVTDVENDALTFTVTQWLGGQSIGYSSASNCSSVTANFPSTVATSSGSTYLCWTPPAATVGTISAFRVQVSDASGAISGQTALVSVNITGSDSNPSYLSGCYQSSAATTVACGTSGAFQGNGSFLQTFDVNRGGSGYVEWSYDRIKALTGAQDIDSRPIQFVITYINSSMLNASSTLQKVGYGNVSSYGSGTGSPAPTAGQLIGPGETLRYQISSTLAVSNDTTYDLVGFKIYDGNANLGSITERRIKVTPRSGGGQNPTLNFSAPIPVYAAVNGTVGPIQGSTWYRLTYDEIRLYLDAYDIDDPGWNLMTLRITGGGTGTLATNVTNMGRDLSSNCTNVQTITNGSSGGAGTYSDLSSGNAICFQISAAAATTLNTSVSGVYSNYQHTTSQLWQWYDTKRLGSSSDPPRRIELKLRSQVDFRALTSKSKPPIIMASIAVRIFTQIFLMLAFSHHKSGEFLKPRDHFSGPFF